jgi:hypothetical protein
VCKGKDKSKQILVRWEYYPQNFLGFVQLACLVILFNGFRPRRPRRRARRLPPARAPVWWIGAGGMRWRVWVEFAVSNKLRTDLREILIIFAAAFLVLGAIFPLAYLIQDLDFCSSADRVATPEAALAFGKDYIRGISSFQSANWSASKRYRSELGPTIQPASPSRR